MAYTPQASTSSLPLPQQPAGSTFVTMTPGNLHDLIRGIMVEQKKLFDQERVANTTIQPTGENANAMAMTAGTAAATVKTTDGRGLKFAEQAPFSGKPEELEPMLREAEVRFSVQSQIYDTDTRKAYYVLSLFKEGNAKMWKEQYLRRRASKTLCEGDSWDLFKATLNESFKDVGSQDDAISKLHTIRQGARQTVDEYNTRFRILVQKAGLDEQENVTLLIQAYIRGLNREIGKRIIIQEPPTTLSHG